jgi:hypothetical protein
MRNHEPIVALRRRGMKPAGVVAILTERCPKGDSDHARWHREGNVFVEPEDVIAALDLRFLVGCVVFISGEDERRVRDLFAAVQDHGAKRVVANCGRVVNGNGRLDLTLDTEGALTWPC